MLNRRQIRIKLFQVFFAYYSEEKPDVVQYEKLMHQSFERFRDLYLLLIMLIGEMQGVAIEKIEAGKNKKLPTFEDLHPNTKFVANSLLRMIVNSKKLSKEAKDRTLSWSDQKDLLKGIFKQLTETPDYKEYMASKERGFQHDREYLVRFFKREMVNFESLHDHLEEQTVLWADDLDLAASMVLKSLKSVNEDDDDITLLPLWKEDDDDKSFTLELWRATLALGESSEKLIAKVATNWESDRIALSDMILMKMALAEVQTFDQIPVKVTMNEYIELSKYYSTPKSSNFINGVLDQLFTDLKGKKKIKKTGRGLVE
ncbi:MAG: transcription antitermination protein NusB [Flavobacteriales bacterium]|nr:transcription antitermination protein NusB [Flavobacteriales bacterium]